MTDVQRHPDRGDDDFSEVEGDVEIPQALSKDLRALFGAEEISDGPEEALIRSRIQFQLASRRRARRYAWRVRAGFAAAGLLCAMAIGLQMNREDRLAPKDQANSAVASEESPPDSADLDGNGRVDILDAFALARQIDDQNAARLKDSRTDDSKSLDLNGDGLSDQRDVDLLAQRAVRLDGGATRRWKRR